MNYEGLINTGVWVQPARMVMEGEGMRLPDAFLTDLRQRVDLVDVISEYVTLRRSGRNFTGLCPFHNEKTPSFSVSSEKQFFHCFGCGASGNVIQFIMDIEGLSFLEAVKTVASRVGIQLPFSDDEMQRDISQEDRLQRMRDAHELATKWYSYILMNRTSGVQALKYLESRALTKSTAVEFRLGYAPDSQQGVVQFLLQRGFDRDTLIDSGLAVVYGNNLVDRFRARVMIPIMDAHGVVVAFGGRAMVDDVKPKYLNSPETPIFHKSRLLFNQHSARKAIRSEKSVLLMEGYMDVISAAQSGIQNVVASLGTAFSSEQAALLKRYSENLIIAYDGDNAGINAAVKALREARSAGLSPRVLVLPEGQDPDSYIRAFGADAFKQHLAASTLSPIQFSIQQLRRQAELRSIAGQQDHIRSVLSLLAEGATPIEVETEIRQLAVDFQVSVEALKEELRRIDNRPKRPTTRREGPEVTTPAAQTTRGDVLAGKRVLQSAMMDAKSRDYLLERGVDELAVAEQTALLALCYGYFSLHQNSDATQFVESIDDEVLRRTAIEIFMMDDAPAPTPDVIEDYLHTIELQRTMDLWRVAIEEWKESVRRQDVQAMESSKTKMDGLAREVQRLKSTLQRVQQ